jgi:hypothetical protein
MHLLHRFRYWLIPVACVCGVLAFAGLLVLLIQDTNRDNARQFDKDVAKVTQFCGELKGAAFEATHKDGWDTSGAVQEWIMECIDK